jgi:hypothetical protein
MLTRLQSAIEVTKKNVSADERENGKMKAVVHAFERS